eukprot:TRINITY_DN150_c0_g1_i3.p1 TRINITY_DN150_c0_g1~~TRINITY_DN150_c0_g1_i3.p1  ORF type:complete len:675 (+),score=175.58 TRINITY_DN150_c0_g1_i3:75-2099(+)
MMSVRRILLSGIVAAFVPEVGATNNGLVLLQRHAETVEADVENSTAGDDDMFDVLHEIKAMDFQLQRKARQQSRHLASTVAEYNAKLKTEEDVIASITQTNARIRQEMEAQQSQNADLRKTLNITKRRLEHVAHDFSTMATSLSETRKNLDVILQEDVELTPPHEISALQIEEVVHPDDAMKHLNSSLDNIHSELEVEISEKFNETYSKLFVHQNKLTRDQKKLNASLAFERQQAVALLAHIDRLEKLMGLMTEKYKSMQANVATIGDVVLQAKPESPKQAESLLQRHAELVVGGIPAENRSAARSQMLDAMKEMHAMDLQLQRKAHEQSERLAATVAELNAKLKIEKQVIANTTKMNAELRHEMEAQQSQNDVFRKTLNLTKRQVEHVAHDLGTMAASLRDASSTLDVILQENVELTPPHEFSALQIADDAQPDDEMEHLGSSLEDIHSEMESGIGKKFNETYSSLLAGKANLIREQKKLDITTAFEHRQGAALRAQINRLEKLTSLMAEKDNSMQVSVAKLGDVVLRAKVEASERAELLRARETQMEDDALPPKSPKASEATKPSPSADKHSPGLFGWAVQASKAALASAGKKVASVFGGAHPQKETAGAKSLHTAHKANTSQKAPVSQNGSHAKPNVSTSHKVAPAKKVAVAAHPAQSTHTSSKSKKTSKP